MGAPPALAAAPTPGQRNARRAPRNDDRQTINGILWILRTGAPWDDLPARYGKRSTVSTRYHRWIDQGIWERIYDAVKADADATGELTGKSILWTPPSFARTSTRRG